MPTTRKRQQTREELLREIESCRKQLADAQTGARFLAGIAARSTENAGSTLRVCLRPELGPENVRMHCRAMWELARAQREYVSQACSLAGIERPTYDDRPAEEAL